MEEGTGSKATRLAQWAHGKGAVIERFINEGRKACSILMLRGNYLNWQGAWARRSVDAKIK